VSRPCLFPECNETHDQGFMVIDSGDRGTVFKLKHYSSSHVCRERSINVFEGHTYIFSKKQMLTQ
jgi:hypothetical protein